MRKAQELESAIKTRTVAQSSNLTSQLDVLNITGSANTDTTTGWNRLPAQPQAQESSTHTYRRQPQIAQNRETNQHGRAGESPGSYNLFEDHQCYGCGNYGHIKRFCTLNRTSGGQQRNNRYQSQNSRNSGGNRYQQDTTHSQYSNRQRNTQDRDYQGYRNNNVQSQARATHQQEYRPQQNRSSQFERHAYTSQPFVPRSQQTQQNQDRSGIVNLVDDEREQTTNQEVDGFSRDNISYEEEQPSGETGSFHERYSSSLNY